MLQIENLSISVEEKEIIHNVSLEISPGELHVLMGPNGSGKSTLCLALMGDPKFTILNSKFKINDIDAKNLKIHERASAGLFLAFQHPVAVPGVRITNFLRMAYNEKCKMHNAQCKTSSKNSKDSTNQQSITDNLPLGPLEFYQLLKPKAKLLDIPEDFLARNLNEQFSGGEKKKMEMLQALVLKPKYAILDEPDTGTDVDALKIIAKGIKLLQKQGTGILLITHYQRLLKYLSPDKVHVLKDGRLVKSGDKSLIKEIEKAGYANY